MKVLLFTHKNDIDGMGNAILAKLAFDSVDHVLCETFDLKKKVEEYFKNKKIYEYEKIFITDLCLGEENLKQIDEDEKLKGKFQIIDHHKTYEDEKYTRFSFVQVKLKNDHDLCCATSLFYEYLLNNNYLVRNDAIDEFVELTRQHDTWEWKNIYNNEKSRELAILFDAIGINGYIKFIYEKLLKEQTFGYNEIERMLIDNKKIEISEAVEEYLDKIYYKNILDLKAGIIFINYEYRNELAEYLRENKYDIDFVMMISLDRGVVSYRSTKDGVSVRKVAEYFGGKGHDKAATNPITSKSKEAILEILTTK
jgi:oligoribonuclease NrnB/cAMP/cGMP phosphodiesterase (DHH superfamily)